MIGKICLVHSMIRLSILKNLHVLALVDRRVIFVKIAKSVSQIHLLLTRLYFYFLMNFFEPDVTNRIGVRNCS